MCLDHLVTDVIWTWFSEWATYLTSPTKRKVNILRNGVNYIWSHNRDSLFVEVHFNRFPHIKSSRHI